MADRVSIKHKRKEAPVWVFLWKPLGRPLSARWLPFFLVGGVFLLALASLRIQVTPPKPWSVRMASLIHAGNDDQGRELALRAREGGPFPSRFEIGDWSGGPAMEREILSLGNRVPSVYVPSLRDLVHDPISSKTRPVVGVLPMLPKHPPGTENDSHASNVKLTPVVRSLAAARVTEISLKKLPPFEHPVNASVEWRFLIQLDAAGNVIECVSLSGVDEEGLPSVTAWLRSVSFKPDPKKASRWIVVEVGFNNQIEDESIHR